MSSIDNAEAKSKATFRLKPKQKVFVENTSTFSFYVGGLGAGKTFAGAVRALVYATQNPGSYGLIGAPTFTMLRDTTMRTFLELCPDKLIKSNNKNEMKIVLINGTEILFRSMDDPDKIRGTNLSWAWMDEAPFCGYYAWKVVKARVGRQDPKKYPRAAWCTGTPKGKDGFYEDFENKPQPDHFLIRASTYENASNLPQGYADSLGYEGAFKAQEIEGRFENFEGLVFTFYPDDEGPKKPAHMWRAGLAFRMPSGAYWVEVDDLPPEHPAHEYAREGLVKVAAEDVPDHVRVVTVKRLIGGVDWGFRNPAVILTYAITEDDRVYQINEFYKRNVQLAQVFIPTIVETARLFEVETMYCDPAEPENLIDLRHAMDKAGVACSVKEGDNDRIAGIHTVRRFLTLQPDGKYQLYVHHLCKSTKTEFGQYQYPTREVSDRNPTELPIPQNDHAMSSMRYALHTAFGVGRTSGIATAGTNQNERGGAGADAEKALADAEKALRAEQELVALRGHAASNFMRSLDAYGLPREGLRRGY